VGAEGTNANHHRSRWAPAVGLGAIAVLVAGVGLAIAAAQHPRSPLIPPPSPTASATPFPLPTPPAAGPVTGLDPSVADDPATHRVVLFGGVDSNNKTWLWDGRHWTSTIPPSSPPNRTGAASAYDPATRTVMLFGGSAPTLGQAVQLFNDTWAWTGSTWRRLNSGGVHGPPIGDGAQMAWDDTRHRMILVTYAGTLTTTETWIWNGSSWRQQPNGNLAAIVFGAVMAYDPASHALVLVSPMIGDNSHSATYRWNGSSWRALVTDGPPVDGFAVDPMGDDLEACGSSSYSKAFAVQASCWQWTGINWVPGQLSLPSAATLSVTIDAEVDDVDRAQLLLIGWLVPPVENEAQPLYVWAWDGFTWMLLA
jgi:hypothetical protein